MGTDLREIRNVPWLGLALASCSALLSTQDDAAVSRRAFVQWLRRGPRYVITFEKIFDCPSIVAALIDRFGMFRLAILERNFLLFSHVAGHLVGIELI
jgi:hypothetical protein